MSRLENRIEHYSDGNKYAIVNNQKVYVTGNPGNYEFDNENQNDTHEIYSKEILDNSGMPSATWWYVKEK